MELVVSVENSRAKELTAIVSARMDDCVVLFVVLTDDDRFAYKLYSVFVLWTSEEIALETGRSRE